MPVARAANQPIRFVDEEEGTLPKLPPLPTPDHKQQRCESSVGFSVSLTRLGLGYAALVGMMSWWPPGARSVGLVVLYAETSIILGALLGMFFGDAGEVRRTKETLTPMPREVEERLRAEEPLKGLGNIKGDGEESYCVRCLVWRRPKPAKKTCVACIPVQMCAKMLIMGDDVAQEAHHCSTCQRCVLNFDHHCGFFGRCIAEGNILYFQTMLTMAVVGPVTVVLFCPFTLGFAFGWVALVALLVVLVAGTVLFFKYDGFDKCNHCCMIFICQVVMPGIGWCNRVFGLDGDDDFEFPRPSAQDVEGENQIETRALASAGSDPSLATTAALSPSAAVVSAADAIAHAITDDLIDNALGGVHGAAAGATAGGAGGSGALPAVEHQPELTEQIMASGPEAVEVGHEGL